VTDDRDATSILVWNGRVSRPRPTPTQEGLRPPVEGGENEHDERDGEDCRGEVVKQARRAAAADDSRPRPTYPPGQDFPNLPSSGEEDD
jgi:hypothetical protein